MANVRIPVETKYSGQAFRQAQQDARRLRKLQERHNKAVLQETKQQIREQRRLSNLTKRLDRDLERSSRRRRGLMESVFLGATGGVLAAGAIERGVGLMKDFAVESALAASEAQRTERAFVGLSGGAEQAAANLAAMEAATRDLVSEQQQQQIANQLLGMEIVDNADDLQRVVEVSRRLGKEFRQLGAAEAAEEFAVMMSNMSFQRLDSFGISSAKVRARVNELTESGQAASREQAFFTATMEEAEKSLQRLGPEMVTTADRLDRLTSRWSDFQVAVGGVGADFGVIDFGVEAMAGMVEEATEFVQIADAVVEKVSSISGAFGDFNINQEAVVGGLRQFGDILQQVAPTLGVGFNLGLEGAIRASEQLASEQDGVADSATTTTTAIQQNTVAVEENTDAYDEAIKRLERVNDIRRDAARDLLQIEEDAAEDVDDLWSDYFADEQKNWADYEKDIETRRKRAAAKAVKDERDLAKQLRRVGQDAEKQIAKIQEDAAKEKRHEAKRRQVDVLGDERLFNFELQQLAAEGQGNAIREAIERRRIEEEIAQEKAAVESDIEAQKLDDQINTIRQTAAERQAQLQQDYDEEQRLNEARLQAEEDAEYESYLERLNQRRDYRDEKLAEIEAGRVEAVAALGEELAEMQELTADELGRLAEMAGELGEDFGESFTAGVQKGLATNDRVSQLLGNDFRRTPGEGSGSPSPYGGPLQSFQFGGTVAGPIGQPTLAIVHGGEKVSPVGQSSYNFNFTYNAPTGGVDERMVEALFQDFVDGTLVPALS